MKGKKTQHVSAVDAKEAQDIAYLTSAIMAADYGVPSEIKEIDQECLHIGYLVESEPLDIYIRVK